MATIDFTYNSIVSTIQCNKNEKIKEICNRFSIKIEKNIDDIYFVYDGSKLDNNLFEKEFDNIANNIDKERNKMNILAYDLNEQITDDNMKQSKEIICPKCKESTRIIIEDYKIILFDCKNGHIIDNLTFDKFEESQIIDESKIICANCQQNNKSNTFGNEFYKCNNCKIYLCPLCKKKHDQSHYIINYDLKYFICEKHNENYISFCNNCFKNMCAICMEEDNGNNHKIDIYKRPNKNNKLNELEELKNNINKMYKEMDKIIQIICNVKKYIDKYFNICDKIINNFDCDLKNRNYEKIENINNIINKDILYDIKEIINDNNINEKFKKIIEINNKIKKVKYDPSNKIKSLMDKSEFKELEYYIEKMNEEIPDYIEKIKENVEMVEDEEKEKAIYKKINEIKWKVSDYKTKFENLKLFNNIAYEKQIHPQQITEFNNSKNYIEEYKEFLNKNENEKIIYWKIPFKNLGISIRYDKKQIYRGKNTYLYFRIEELNDEFKSKFSVIIKNEKKDKLKPLKLEAYIFFEKAEKYEITNYDVKTDEELYIILKNNNFLKRLGYPKVSFKGNDFKFISSMINDFKNLLFDMKKQLALIKNGNFENLNLLKSKLKELNYKYQIQYKDLLYYFDIKDNDLSDCPEINKITEIKYTFDHDNFLIKKEFETLNDMIFRLIDDYLYKLNKGF